MSEERAHRFESPDGAEVLISIHCPGCGYSHPFRIKGDGYKWTWNGDMTKPTFTPSMLVNQSDPASRCHSHVKDGNIQFLADSWHALKGQTVPLPVWNGL